MFTFLSGWKTIIAGVGAMLAGAGMIVAAVGGLAAGGEFHIQPFAEGITVFSGGLAAIGVGHKIDKNTEAVVENTEKK